MARPTNASQFLRVLRENGGKIGNGPLRSRLEWDEDKYWRVHEELFSGGLIAKGRGYGGTVILIVPESDADAAKAAENIPKASASLKAELVAAHLASSIESQIAEIDLYDPALLQLKGHWVQRKQLDCLVCEKSAHQVRRDTGGSWSRPDLVAVGLKTFEYLPDRVLEVYSFEIKAEYDVSVKGVLEALSHREAATRSYVIYHTNGKSWDDFAEAQRIEELAARHGIGVLVASQINDLPNCWDERVTAVKSNSDPEIVDNFIKATMSEDSKSQIRKWL